MGNQDTSSEAIITVVGGSFVLPEKRVDTDQIIPAEHLLCITFEGLGQHVFASNRAAMGGKHPFDRPEHQGRSILIADENFGCGSSREHAVPALNQWGIQCIIAPSFAPIFIGNATGNGVVCARVLQADYDRIVSFLNPQDNVTCENTTVVNLNSLTIVINIPGKGSETFDFAMSEADQYNLTNGTWNALTTCLQAGDLIEQTAARLPYLN